MFTCLYTVVMRNFRKTLRNWAIFLPLLLIIVIIIGGLTYLSGSLFLFAPSTENIQTPFAITAIATLDNSSIERFAQIDPAIVNVIDSAPSNYGNTQLDSLGIQPVGIYLPRTGDTQFEILDPTPFPTPLPFPTSPPLPLPPLAVLPTVAPVILDAAGEENVRILPYNTGECAPYELPVEGILSQGFHRYHSGIDVAVSSNTPVLATHSGQVTFADWSEIGYGYLIIIQNSGFITYYAHNASFNVNSGDLVGQGSIIAWSGNTGNSSGPHVHYETRINDIPVDPLSFSARGYETC
mgnify:CR=1 FL=1